MEIEEQYNTMRLNTFGSGLVLKPPVITLDLYKEGLVFLVTLFSHGTGSLKFEIRRHNQNKTLSYFES